jgi:hypothetical protein
MLRHVSTAGTVRDNSKSSTVFEHCVVLHPARHALSAAQEWCAPAQQHGQAEYFVFSPESCRSLGVSSAQIMQIILDAVLHQTHHASSAAQDGACLDDHRQQQDCS